MVCEYWQKRAALEWQVELGVSDALEEKPLNRYALTADIAPEAMPAPRAEPIARSPEKPLEKSAHFALSPETRPSEGARGDAGASEVSALNPVELAEKLAQGVRTLDELARAQASYEFCEIKKGAQNFVFADGQLGARVMIIGEAPGRDEDIQGKPFVGQAGQLLDRMFAAIDMGRAHAEAPLYIANILPWRPPQNRQPTMDEIEMMMPFMRRHIAFADPEILVLMGNIACQAILQRQAITRIRGTWFEALGKPVLPMLHPAYLLRNPAAKAQSWQDLLALKHALERRG